MPILFNQPRDLSSIYTYDASAGTFSADNAANAAGFNYFPATSAVGDIVYFGVGGYATTVDLPMAFKDVLVNVGTAYTFSSGGVTVVWEYYKNATGWITLSVTDPTSGFTVTGANTVSFTPPEDWRSTTVNGKSCFWVRARITALGTVLTDPLQSATKVQVGDFYIMVNQGTEGSPTRLSDILAAAVACGWGVFTNQGKHYLAKCHMCLGTWQTTGVVTSALLIKDGEVFELWGHFEGRGASGSSNTFTAGELISLPNGTTKNGGTFIIDRTRYDDHWYNFSVSRGAVKLYHSYIYGTGSSGSFLYCEANNGTQINCLINNLVTSGFQTYQRITNYSPISGQILDAVTGLSDIFVYGDPSASFAWRGYGGISGTYNVPNPKFRDVAHIYKTEISSFSTSPFVLNMINADTPNWNMYWGFWGSYTTLTGDHDDTTTTITVNAASAYPSAGTIQIDSERISYTSRNGTQFLNCTRGAENTTRTTHTNSTTVYYKPPHTVNEAYTVDIKVISPNNTPVASARVRMYDKDMNLLFNGLVNSSGVLSQRVVTAKAYTWAGGNDPGTTAVTNYNDFTLRVSKSGYKTFIKKITLNAKVNEVIKLDYALSSQDLMPMHT